MEAGIPSTEPLSEPSRVKLWPLVQGAMWLVGLRAALLVLAGFLGNSPLAEVVLGALLVDVAAGRAGVLWTTREIGKLALRRVCAIAGGTTGVPIVLTLILAAALGHVSLATGSPSVMLIASVVGAITQALRDELLLRAVPLHFLRAANVPERAAIVFVTLISPTAFLHTGPSAAAIVFSLSSGALFSVIYVRMAGAWAAITAHAVLLVLTGPLLRGGVLEAAFHHGELADGALAAGAPAFIASAMFLLAAGWVWKRRAPASDEPPTEQAVSPEPAP